VSDLAALVVQQSVNGVYLGCLYVMVALGLTLIYGVLNQINFAHADFVTVGAFTAFFTATRFATKVLGLPDTGGYLLSLVAALVAFLLIFGRSRAVWNAYLIAAWITTFAVVNNVYRLLS